MVLRIMAEGLTAYYNRDPEALRSLLQRVEELRPKLRPQDTELLEEIINGWIRQSRSDQATGETDG